MSNQTEWVVKYKLPGDQVRTPREIVVRATTQSDAKKVAQAMIPSATILGGPQQVRYRSVTHWACCAKAAGCYLGSVGTAGSINKSCVTAFH